MEIEVKQRNRRRKRAQRMQQELKVTNANKAIPDESETEDVVPKKPPRPPNRRKKQKDLLKEPLCEEDLVEGFSILQFRNYEDLELVVKIAAKEGLKRLTEIERPKIEPKAHVITNHILVHNNHNGLTLTHDPATSDDSGRASERLTGSSVVSVAPRERDADSSRDRLSDASSRCSSGKGYICDSEGEDDKGSDASSVIFPSAPSVRKHEFPGALPPSLPQGLPHGPGSSPLPAPTPPIMPVPSPAPAHQPPQHPMQAIPSAAVAPAVVEGASIKSELGTKVPPVTGQDFTPPAPMSCAPPAAVAPQPPPPLVASMPPATALVPPPAAAPAAPHHHHHHATSLDPTVAVGRIDSPAVATSANAAVAPSPGQYHHSYQPLYTPYAYPSTPAYPNSVPYATPPSVVPPAVTQPATMVPPPTPPEKRSTTPPKVALSPRAPEAVVRERESYSSVMSLSRSSSNTNRTTTPVQSHPQPPSTVVSSSLAVQSSTIAQAPLAKPWATPATVAPAPAAPLPSRLSPAPPRPAQPLHSGAYAPSGGAQPMFAPPTIAPPAVSTAPSTPTASNPNPFSAESLFQTKKHSFPDQADMLRRELDNRFLASQDRGLGVAPPPYLRTEMHQHQHHHTHVHQHTTSLLPPPGSGLFPSQMPLSPMDRLARRTQSSFKDIPKLGSVDSSFYRQGLGVPTYPGYNPGLMGHPGLTTGPTPFVPPNHLPTFQPKSLSSQDPSKPKIMKNGKWNAMHVRVAWEIYHHQQKSGDAKGSLAGIAPKPGVPNTADLLRAPSHLFSPGMHSRPPELGPYPPSGLGGHRPVGFEQPSHHGGSLFAAPSGHLGKSPFTNASSMSPFSRYAGAPMGASGGSPFSMSPFGASRGDHLGLGPLHHDPWRAMQRSMSGFPPAVNALPPSLPGLPPGPAPWTLKPDPVLEQREREREAREREERERERLRREREERERREREEKQRRLEQQQQQERERERREKERREMERRENERREREREVLLHQQRMAAETAAKQSVPVMRDRSPLRNGQPEMSEIRVKEEPRVKEEDLLARTDPRTVFRYHPYLRHPGSLQPPPPSALDRSRMLAHSLQPHYPPASHWPPTTMASDPFYHRYSYNHLMDPMRSMDDRAAAAASYYGAYAAAHHQSQLRPKDPSLLHLRGGPGPPQPVHKMSATPPTEIHKKEEPR
ncbi:unnamed protein product [Ceutorhynchus assimilis]|uniref:Uncharacterized protein n=1 Tax=Ceutorhynchus assimilis TaxID=467358 RepID=A0A9P0DGC5_9CUCU|nr:unnamed protein product [Ceutorhynchus assimilis]